MAIVAVAFVAPARAVRAQGGVGAIRRPSLSAGATWESWRFATPLPTDSLQVDRVSQLSLPLGTAIPLGARFTFDVSGAYAVGSARLVDSLGRSARTLELRGLTDVKLRLVGRLAGDAVLLTLGLNAPTGLTRLGGEEVSALRLVGAPALRMPSPTLGSGLGATAGLVFARQVGGWGVATGATYEQRASYTPVDIAVAGVSSVTDLDPSDALHLSVGADRLIGEHRLSFLGSMDRYGEDRLTLRDGGNIASGTYRLGPTISALALLEFGVPGFQELSVALIDRYRTSYRGLDGATVAGSSGNQFEARVQARLGNPGRMAWMLGGDARFDTGLDVDTSLATAAMNAVGATLGLSLPLGGVALEPVVRASVGTIDTGARSSRATGIGVSLTLVRR